jgi:pimeloyl-ACP methyl ester carboxylesterase
MTASFCATLDGWQAHGKTFSFRGRTLFYQASQNGGTGPHLLLLHGLPTASWDYHRLWPALDARCASLLALDMLGFGFSDKPHDHD